MISLPGTVSATPIEHAIQIEGLFLGMFVSEPYHVAFPQKRRTICKLSHRIAGSMDILLLGRIANRTKPPSKTLSKGSTNGARFADRTSPNGINGLFTFAYFHQANDTVAPSGVIVNTGGWIEKEVPKQTIFLLFKVFGFLCGLVFFNIRGTNCCYTRQKVYTLT